MFLIANYKGYTHEAFLPFDHDRDRNTMIVVFYHDSPIPRSNFLDPTDRVIRGFYYSYVMRSCQFVWHVYPVSPLSRLTTTRNWGKWTNTKSQQNDPCQYAEAYMPERTEWSLGKTIWSFDQHKSRIRTSYKCVDDFQEGVSLTLVYAAIFHCWWGIKVGQHE